MTSVFADFLFYISVMYSVYTELLYRLTKSVDLQEFWDPLRPVSTQSCPCWKGGWGHTQAPRV